MLKPSSQILLGTAIATAIVLLASLPLLVVANDDPPPNLMARHRKLVTFTIAVWFCYSGLLAILALRWLRAQHRLTR